MSHGPDADTFFSQAYLTQELVSACYNGWAQAATELLKKGADPRCCTHRGIPAIGIAAGHGHVATMLAVLENGGNIDQRDTFGDTPIMRAIIRGKTTIFQVLWERGASLDIPNYKGLTARDLVQQATDPAIEQTYRAILQLEADGKSPSRGAIRRILDRQPQHG